MTREFIRLPEFEKQSKNTGLDEDDIIAIELFLLDNPSSGVIIQGTGGIRKLRFSLPNTGKSGGVRVIYIDYASYAKIYLFTVYAKAETENLTQAEKNALKDVAKTLLAELRKKG
jgi:hypothetical protein